MINSERFYVYVHSRLCTGVPFYVGKGCAYRWASKHTRTSHWRNIVAKDGSFHNSFIARNIDEELAFLIEIEAINKYRRLGVKLTNASDGGEGPSGMKLSEETKKKLSIINIGKKHSAETRAKISSSNIGKVGGMKGKSVSPETRAKLSAAGMGRSPTQETKEKLRAKFKGRPLDEDTKRKIREALIGRVSPKKGKPGARHSDETRRKMSEAKKGKKPNNFGKSPSQDCIEKRRVSLLATWARRKLEAKCSD